MIDREKLREILRRADAKRTTTSPSAPDDARGRRRQALERAGLIEIRPEQQSARPLLSAGEPIEVGDEDIEDDIGGARHTVKPEASTTEVESVENVESETEPVEPPPVPADVIYDEEEIRLSKEGEELLEFMRVELADLPNPFERMEAGELNYSFVDKQKEIERRVAKIAAEVLKKFGTANGKKLKELEVIVQQITDELLDRDEAAAVFYLVDVLRRGRNGFGVVLDEERMLEARNRLFERGEVSPLSAGRSDFEAVDNKLFWQSISVASKLLEGVGGDKGRQFLKRYDSIIFPDDVKRNYAILLSAGKVLRCLAVLAFVKDRNKVAGVYPPDLLSFDANPDFKQKFEELYRGAIQRLNDKIKNGEVKIDTSDDRAVKEALRPYSDFAVANGALGFDWKRLREKYGVS